jgi:hypothetical protein
MVKNKFFIIASYSRTLKNPAHSSKINIGKDESAWQQNEAIKCAKNLKSRDYSEAGVILDVANQKVIKNRYSDDKPFGELFEYYLTHYKEYINGWLKKQIAGQ